MSARKNVLGFIDAGRKVRRAPLVGMQFLHESPVRTTDVVDARARRQAQDLIGLLLRHFAGAPRPRHRCRTALRVLSPRGVAAVKIRHQ